MIKEIETMLRKEFPNQYTGVKYWTNQDVMLAILEAKNISSNLPVSGQVCPFFICSNTGGKCDKCGKEQWQH